MPLTASATTPRYTSDITQSDLDALDAFLTERVCALAMKHDHGAEESNAASALSTALISVTHNLRRTFEYDDGSAEILKARRRHWNLLCRIAEPWQQTEGYDHFRWRTTQYTDAASEERMARYYRKQVR
ncbi:hypothetical protein AB0F18_16860 [Streptomyces sp. NPDC029216]|uniref:hypothetical protein n=1 Tax=Streptomyces sp. NPDC029216 TaxID=3154701 RepID=UPI0033F11117